MPYNTLLDGAIEVTGVNPTGENMPKTPKQMDQPPEAVLKVGTSNYQFGLEQKASLEVMMGDKIFFYYGNSRDPELKPLKYYLDFGNGEHDSSAPRDGPPAYFVYSNDGDFTMTLTVTDIQGNTGTATTKIKVLPAIERDWVPDGLNDACKEYRKTGVLPKSFDWHSINGKDYMARVRDQGSCLTCWIFGPVGAIEAAYKIQNKNPDTELDLSEQTILSCMQGAVCGAGGSSLKVLDYIKDKGLPEENCFIYETGHTPSMPATPCKDCKSAAAWTIEDYISLPADDISRLKETIICDGPIVASSGSLGHDFVISGYDDASAICKSHYGLDGCWIYKDSFGVFTGNKDYSRAEVSIWHEDGYAYFPYYALNSDGKPFMDRALINDAYAIKGVKKQ
jgi:C1A family cysteine protease